jgi:cephalosporin-C deacetylase-like acetyl esterase
MRDAQPRTRVRRQAVGDALAAALALLVLQTGPFLCAEETRTDYELTLRADRQSALYKVGETVRFQGQLLLGGRPAQKTVLRYVLRRDSHERIAAGALEFRDGKAEVTHRWNRPGFMLCTVSFPRSMGRIKPVSAGAACSPGEIAPSMPKPEDFDSFWAGKKRLLDAMPPPELTPVEQHTNAEIETFAVRFENINGSNVHGYFAKPRGDGRFPAFMYVHGAGVGSVRPSNVAGYAARGALAIDINAHDIENGQPKAYYDELRNGALKGYPLFGRDSRETSYFLRMFCACYRAAEYIASRPDWNRKQFLVYGSSQGGGQAFATAGLCSSVTAFAANVPALCDHTGPVVGRAAGWPRLVTFASGQGDEKQLQASRYFDCVNFARTIQAKALVSAGFIDGTCPPSTVYAAYNALPGEKTMLNMPERGHVIPPEFKTALQEFIRKEMGFR